MTTTLSPRAILEALVGFPTVSTESNLDLVAWVEDYLTGHGITCHRHYDESGQKAALFAHVGPEIDAGVVLSGHTDVVPIEGQDWTSDAFTVSERDGRLYGRGTCDMKGFDALAIWALVEATKRDLTQPLQIALSYDEEIGCTGAPPMIDQMLKTLPKATAVIVGEPSMMKAVNGHKGGIGFNVHAKGFEVHSSIMHTGVSAIMDGARLIDWARTTNAANAEKTPDAVDGMFEPPWTTVHVGVINGGTAHNITAADCHFGVDFRCVPGESVQSWASEFHEEVARVDALMKAVHPDAGLDVSQKFHVPALKPEAEGAAETLVRQLTGDNGTHVVSYGTEAGQFQERGYSVVICGPGDIAQAHQPDEYLELSQFHEGERFMARLIDHLCT